MTVLSQPVVSVFKLGTFSVVLRVVSECTAAKVAGVVSIRCGLCSTGARQTSVAIKCNKGFCVHRHIPQRQTTRRQQPSRYGQCGQV